MFNEIKSAFSKFFTGQRIILFIIVIILAFALLSYSSSKSYRFDGMNTGTDTVTDSTSNHSTVKEKENVSVPNTDSIYKLQTVANPSDLLPQDKNSQWSTLNPTLNPNNVIIPDLLEAGYNVGLDSVGQSLRNTNLQLRSDPIIPKVDAWNGINMSTIEPDVGRVPLEIGYGCR